MSSCNGVGLVRWGTGAAQARGSGITSRLGSPRSDSVINQSLSLHTSSVIDVSLTVPCHGRQSRLPSNPPLLSRARDSGRARAPCSAADIFDCHERIDMTLSGSKAGLTTDAGRDSRLIPRLSILSARGSRFATRFVPSMTSNGPSRTCGGRWASATDLPSRAERASRQMQTPELPATQGTAGRHAISRCEGNIFASARRSRLRAGAVQFAASNQGRALGS